MGNQKSGWTHRTGFPHCQGREKTLVCADCVGAGPGERVLVAQGGAARVAAGLSVPVDAAVVGILDT